MTEIALHPACRTERLAAADALKLASARLQAESFTLFG